MTRSGRRNGIRPKRPNGYLTGDAGDTAPIRRPLRTATTADRVLIYLFVFIAGCLLTLFGYLYIIAEMGRYRRLPFSEMTGNAARLHFWMVVVIGGIVAVVLYAILSIVDPYGNKAAEKAREAEKRKKALLIQEIRKNQARRHPQGNPKP